MSSIKTSHGTTAALAKVTIQLTRQSSTPQTTGVLRFTAVNTTLYPMKVGATTVSTVQGTADVFLGASAAGRFGFLIPSTGLTPMRFSGSTTEIGIAVTSLMPSLIPMTTATTVHVYTTGLTTLRLRFAVL